MGRGVGAHGAIGPVRILGSVILPESDLLGDRIIERVGKRLHQMILVVVVYIRGQCTHLLIDSRDRVSEPLVLGLHGKDLYPEILRMRRSVV